MAQGGTFEVPVAINDAIVLRFTIDSGAADVSIPADVVSTLVRTGTLSREDFIGERTYVLADGTEVPSATFRIRKLKVGTLVLHDVTGSLANAKAPLLLGQSFLSRLTSWSIDNERQVLVLRTTSDEAELASTAVATNLASDGDDGAEFLLSRQDAADVAAEFNRTLNASGMMGVTGQVQSCYEELSGPVGPVQRKRAAYCVTLDLLALRFDAAVRDEMSERVGRQVPPLEFYERTALQDRMSRYLPLTTPTREVPSTEALVAHVERAEKALLALQQN